MVSWVELMTGLGRAAASNTNADVDELTTKSFPGEAVPMPTLPSCVILKTSVSDSAELVDFISKVRSPEVEPLRSSNTPNIPPMEYLLAPLIYGEN